MRGSVPAGTVDPRLLLCQPFPASLALHLEIVPVRDPRVGTAATDGRHVYFDVAFADHFLQFA